MPLTLRKLEWMYRAVRFEAWSHTSALISSVLNMFAEKGKEVEMDHFNLVLREEEAAKKTPKSTGILSHKGSIDVLKVFVSKGKR